jgi:hypothetical protein
VALSSSSSPVVPRVRSPLAECLVALAGTPDDSSWIEAQLTGIAHLAADCIPEVNSAWVVAADGDPDIVLASSDDDDNAADELSSVSIPLFAGQGTVIAVLNLHGRDPHAMAALANMLRHAYEPGDHNGTVRDVTSGASGLITGLTEAFAVRATIQQAIGILMLDAGRTPDIAYLLLRQRAAETGIALPDTAAAVIAEKLW